MQIANCKLKSRNDLRYLAIYILQFAIILVAAVGRATDWRLYLACFSPSSPKVADSAIFAPRFCTALSIDGSAGWVWNNLNCFGDIDLRRLVFVCVA